MVTLALLVLGVLALGCRQRFGITVMVPQTKVASSDGDTTKGAVAEFDTAISTLTKAAHQLFAMLFVLFQCETGRLQ